MGIDRTGHPAARMVMMAGVFLLTLGPAIVSTGGAQATPGAGGTQLWVGRFNGPANGSDFALSEAISPDGSKVFVTGKSRGPGSTDYATVAYDAATGTQLWEARYDGPGYGTDWAYAIGIAPDGSKVFVTGKSRGATSLDFATVAYDAGTGTQLWVARYDSPSGGDDWAVALAVSRDGSKVFVAGQSSTPTSNFDYATVAYDAAMGNQLWLARYDGSARGPDVPAAISVSPDDSTVFVTGDSVGYRTSDDFATVAYDAATGNHLWVSRYNGPGNSYDAGKALAVSPDGLRVFVTGYSVGTDGNRDYGTVAYDTRTGSPLWVRRYNGPGNGDDFPTAIASSLESSKVFVTGYVWGNGDNFDYATLAYDATSGNRIWRALFDGPIHGEDYAFGIASSRDGSQVFVTGSVKSGSNSSYGTLAYNAADGTTNWETRYDGPGGGADNAYAVAVSPDGSRVFVTGQSWGGGTGDDYATVANAAT